MSGFFVFLNRWTHKQSHVDRVAQVGKNTLTNLFYSDCSWLSLAKKYQTENKNPSRDQQWVVGNGPFSIVGHSVVPGHWVMTDKDKGHMQ